MEITVNGEKVLLKESATVTQLITHLSLPAQRVAVERNKEVVRRAMWNEVKLERGDKIEIVHFVGGG